MGRIEFSDQRQQHSGQLRRRAYRGHGQQQLHATGAASLLPRGEGSVVARQRCCPLGLERRVGSHFTAGARQRHGALRRDATQQRHSGPAHAQVAIAERANGRVRRGLGGRGVGCELAPSLDGEAADVAIAVSRGETVAERGGLGVAQASQGHKRVAEDVRVFLLLQRGSERSGGRRVADAPERFSGGPADFPTRVGEQRGDCVAEFPVGVKASGPRASGQRDRVARLQLRLRAGAQFGEARIGRRGFAAQENHLLGSQLRQRERNAAVAELEGHRAQVAAGEGRNAVRRG